MRGIKLDSNLQSYLLCLKLLPLNVISVTYILARKRQTISEASNSPLLPHPLHSLCIPSFSRKTRFKPPSLNVNVSLVLSSKSLPSSPGANETSKRAISKLITARISINASCLPMHPKGPVVLSKASSQGRSRLQYVSEEGSEWIE